MSRKTWVQHPQTGKLVPADEVDWPRHMVHGPKSFQIMEDIDPFVSPVDGSVVSSRSNLRAHNKRNDVVNFHEFDGVAEEVTTQRKAAERKDVLNDVVEATERVSQGYKPNISKEGELEHE